MGKHEIMARIGETLVQVQRTERLINFVVQHTLPSDDLSKLFQLGGRRPPLGRLIRKLSAHVKVGKAFQRELDEFLFERNRFVHEIEFIEGWTLETVAGLKTASRFLDRLSRLERSVNRVFLKVARAWPTENSAELGP